MTEGQEDDVLLTLRQQRQAAREARRQAKDDAYEERLARKRSKDVQFFHGHHVVDTRGLNQAFPEPESPEFSPASVRRRVVHAVTLVLLVAVVVAGVILAGMVQRGELELKIGFARPTTPAVTCPAEKLDYPANKAITVNVFNGGSTEGMAGKVAAELKKRGYKVGTVANAKVEYTTGAVVVSGPGGHAAAFNLQRNVLHPEYVQDDRTGPSVDVILTGEYAGLVAAPKVDQTPGVLSCPRLSPSPSGPPASGPPASGRASQTATK
ncbi:LytR C-terminal domain-containing protein [Specibacter sp. RAF43]|uniref:LytR C-terminal domain-containing protein n=1 Tax=Specibacter sp. RAF43 TaxID=3233057 RepID=UPI003F980A04